MTGDLVAWQAGDADAGDRAFAALLPWLRRIASRQLHRGGRDLSLQVTELLHEAYLRLARRDRIRWQNREHFLAIGARLMRRVLIDYARRGRRLKRDAWTVQLGGDGPEIPAHGGGDLPDLLSLDAALDRLAAIDEQAAQLVELRFFAGFSVEEAADLLGIGRTTVVRRWQYARAWLRDALDHPVETRRR